MAKFCEGCGRRLPEDSLANYHAGCYDVEQDRQKKLKEIIEKLEVKG